MAPVLGPALGRVGEGTDPAWLSITGEMIHFPETKGSHMGISREAEASSPLPSIWTARGQAEEPQELRAVAEVIIHPEYLPETSSADIALVQLASPVTYSDLILPVCLPKPGDPLDHGTWCWVTGWGNIDLSIPLPPPFTLKELSLPLIDAPTCDGYYHENSDTPIQEPIILEDMLCAGFESGQKDACGGDSGGPLVCDVGGVWVQAGVVSWGFACGLPKRPGVYINVSTYATWIASTIPGSDLHTENSSPRLAGLFFPPVLLVLWLLGDTFAPMRLA
ncbi:tryptase-like isoform X2 [Lutra lutra]|uniref:tryptase-like isoform X2 n=1 Tax=Lutra lutra TaxID=9657 RepID=UPI001FD0B133|nr:tryptase-like isoform X2 [Lutra lutra]